MEPYKKIGWVDHVEDVTTGEVIQEGTPLSQTNMNHMDDGIFQNREAVITHEAQIADAQKEIKVLKVSQKYVIQAAHSWLGFARWASAYNLAKKIFGPYRFIKTEGALPYGAISRNRQARRILQQRGGYGPPHKTLAA